MVIPFFLVTTTIVILNFTNHSIGFGISAVSSISPVLRKTNVTTMSNADCDAIYSIIYPGIICITTANDGHGSCNVSGKKYYIICIILDGFGQMSM